MQGLTPLGSFMLSPAHCFLGVGVGVAVGDSGGEGTARPQTLGTDRAPPPRFSS